MVLHPPADQDIIIFGATGDLASRKLLPALYNLFREGLTPQRGNIIGAAPDAGDEETFRAHVRDAVAGNSRTGLDEEVFARFAARLRVVVSGESLQPLCSALSCERRLVYLAVPASAFEPLTLQLGAQGFAEGTSLIIEKPFGHNLESAQHLNAVLHSVFPEERIFRIDHYLGKETVQNMLVFRFGNSLFERVWNRDAIRRVEITVAESIGVEHRGSFYEETGAIRDIVQNHLFQLLAITCMEPPISFDAEAIRNEKVKVLRAAHPLQPEDVVRGQYVAGCVDGAAVSGYRGESGVARDSTT
ncbi:MAG TPA: glucose-6-phosphate dehydrogenase, partial [Candidatus Sulfotelmatobacter sp.]|nr:glucose-6-phosphate dehydrogenase [Candidatus Sulfotelmatobacter sp.]